jgi:asparagine synthase (glutamine-hydrolysing)
MYGESEKSKNISKKLKINNYNAILGPNHIIDNMNKVCYHLESPFTSIRVFGTFELYKLAKKNNIKVIIEGHGGDEIFAGYKHHEFPSKIDDNIEKKNYQIINSFSKAFSLENFNLDKKFNNQIFSLFFQPNVTKDLTPISNLDNFNKDFIKDNFKNNDDLNLDGDSFLKNSQLMDIRYISMPRTLKYSDRLSGSQGIENRVPFLQHEFAKYCFNLHHKYKFRNGEARWAFKQNLRKTKINSFVTKSKKIIADPQIQWFKKDLKDYILDTFKSSEFKNLDFFNSKNVIKNYEKLCKSETNSSFALFQILSFFYFQKTFKNF